MGEVNTHGELIIIPGIGHAFIDGVPNNHECDSKGEPAYWTASGKRLRWHTIRAWAHLTWEARLPLLEEHFREKGDPITAGSSSCSICGAASIEQWRDTDRHFENNGNKQQ